MLEENTKMLHYSPGSWSHFFDLVGTSTGVIALMLGRLRMYVDTAISYCNNLVKQVFSDSPKKVKLKFRGHLWDWKTSDMFQNPEKSLLRLSLAGTFGSNLKSGMILKV